MCRNCLFLFVCIGLSASIGAAGANPVETAAVTPGDVMLPQGHRMALYLDCGGNPNPVSNDDLSMACLSGAGHVFSGIAGPLGSALYAPDQVVFQLNGLRPGSEYVLGFTWWDADDSGRVQSVAFAAGEAGTWQTVLPPVRAAAFHADSPPGRGCSLPLAAPSIRAVRCGSPSSNSGRMPW